MSDDLIQKFSGLVDMAEGGLQSKVHERSYCRYDIGRSREDS